MLPVLVLCLLLVSNVCIAANNQGRSGDVRPCVDNDALIRETFAAIESAVKVSQYGRQSEKLKALDRLEKHVTNMRPIIMAEVPHPTEIAVPSTFLPGVYAEDYPSDCAAALASDSYLDSGVYTIAPPDMGPGYVVCDMDTDGGGWTVFQKREDGRVSFDADFDEFARGFGEVSGDYWLGNYALRNMTNPEFGRFELRVDLWDWNENHRYAVYQDFSVTGEDFTLNIGEYSGDAGDSLSFHNGLGFTTRDHDVDGASGGNCAVWLYSGWWYNYCHRVNLNGHYKNEVDATTGLQEDQGLQWFAWKGNQYSLKKTEMKFRPIPAIATLTEMPHGIPVQKYSHNWPPW